MKKPTKKLDLRTQTIHTLTTDTLGVVAGGAPPPKTQAVGCGGSGKISCSGG
ncbi:MAG TPA: hypothetical protein VL463_22945 [Kofleriaceae bacterium]|jgi:hypothetical protein|nr:hypothetical protein [Kofleriaceae bacterium]